MVLDGRASWAAGDYFEEPLKKLRIRLKKPTFSGGGASSSSSAGAFSSGSSAFGFFRGSGLPVALAFGWAAFALVSATSALAPDAFVLPVEGASLARGGVTFSSVSASDFAAETASWAFSEVAFPEVVLGVGAGLGARGDLGAEGLFRRGRLRVRRRRVPRSWHAREANHLVRDLLFRLRLFRGRRRRSRRGRLLRGCSHGGRHGRGGGLFRCRVGLRDRRPRGPLGVARGPDIAVRRGALCRCLLGGGAGLGHCVGPLSLGRPLLRGLSALRAIEARPGLPLRTGLAGGGGGSKRGRSFSGGGGGLRERKSNTRRPPCAGRGSVVVVAELAVATASRGPCAPLVPSGAASSLPAGASASPPGAAAASASRVDRERTMRRTGLAASAFALPSSVVSSAESPAPRASPSLGSSSGAVISRRNRSTCAPINRRTRACDASPTRGSGARAARHRRGGPGRVPRLTTTVSFAKRLACEARGGLGPLAAPSRQGGARAERTGTIRFRMCPSCAGLARPVSVTVSGGREGDRTHDL